MVSFTYIFDNIEFYTYGCFKYFWTKQSIKHTTFYLTLTKLWNLGGKTCDHLFFYKAMLNKSTVLTSDLIIFTKPKDVHKLETYYARLKTFASFLFALGLIFNTLHLVSKYIFFKVTRLFTYFAYPCGPTAYAEN